MKNKLLFCNRFYPSWNLAFLFRKIYMLKSILLEFTLCKIGLHYYQHHWISPSQRREIGKEYGVSPYCYWCGKLSELNEEK